MRDIGVCCAVLVDTMEGFGRLDGEGVTILFLEGLVGVVETLLVLGFLPLGCSGSARTRRLCDGFVSGDVFFCSFWSVTRAEA